MERTTILEGYSDKEKGAYLGAVASIATADRQALRRIEYVSALCDAADVSEHKRKLLYGCNRIIGRRIKQVPRHIEEQ